MVTAILSYSNVIVVKLSQFSKFARVCAMDAPAPVFEPAPEPLWIAVTTVAGSTIKVKAEYQDTIACVKKGYMRQGLGCSEEALWTELSPLVLNADIAYFLASGGKTRLCMSYGEMLEGNDKAIRQLDDPMQDPRQSQ